MERRYINAAFTAVGFLRESIIAFASDFICSTVSIGQRKEEKYKNWFNGPPARPDGGRGMGGPLWVLPYAACA